MNVETVITLAGVVLVLFIIASIAGATFFVVQWRSIKKHQKDMEIRRKEIKGNLDKTERRINGGNRPDGKKFKL